MFDFDRSMIQGSPFDAGAEVGLDPLRPRRVDLGVGAWIDLAPGWLRGADDLYDVLREQIPWRAERRQMYERVVDVPRLTCFYDGHEPLPHPVLAEARDALSAHYRSDLGEPFVSLGFCLYRDGADSVAWHGDRIGRSRDQDTMIAIVSVGSARDLALRPRDGGPSRRFALGHGDLAVMGGSCQRTWDHAVPKASGAVGPRISIQYRVAGVR